jgi:hypothetical protein
VKLYRTRRRKIWNSLAAHTVKLRDILRQDPAALPNKVDGGGCPEHLAGPGGTLTVNEEELKTPIWKRTPSTTAMMSIAHP